MAITNCCKSLRAEIKYFPEYFPIAATDQAIKLFGPDHKIDRRKNQVDNKEKNKDNSDEFPQGQVKHIMKNAESFMKGDPFFYQVVAAVFINEAATCIIRVAGKARVVVLF